MADVTLWGHAPCGYRYWTVKGDPDPVHDCPKEGGRRVPLVTAMRKAGIDLDEDDLVFVAQMLLSLDTGMAGSGLGRFLEPDRTRLQRIANGG